MSDITTPCREWRGPVNPAGYGMKRSGRKQPVLVHRWSVAQIDGWPAIAGKVVMHRCDNPLCYRYSHLRIGTQAQNMADMVSKGRHANQVKTTCKHGHPFDVVQVVRTGKQAGVVHRRCSVCDAENQRRRRIKLREG